MCGSIDHLWIQESCFIDNAPKYYELIEHTGRKVYQSNLHKQKERSENGCIAPCIGPTM